MEIFLLFFILFICLVKNSIGDVVCYQCHANSTTSGLTCSIDNLCTSSYCVGVLYSDMTWYMDCGPKDGEPPADGCNKDPDTNIISCSCKKNFCNSIDKLLPSITEASGSTEDVPAILPHRNLTCLECGQVVTKDGTNHTIPCTAENTCRGVQCLTKRSVHPISYCITSWDAPVILKCRHEIGNDEICGCFQDYCNIPYNPLEIVVTTTEVPSTTIPIPTTTTTEPGTIICPDGMKYGPNEQAVIMGEKLKDIILGNFGKYTSNATTNFESGINYHICNYKNGRK